MMDLQSLHIKLYKPFAQLLPGYWGDIVPAASLLGIAREHMAAKQGSKLSHVWQQLITAAVLHPPGESKKVEKGASEERRWARSVSLCEIYFSLILTETDNSTEDIATFLHHAAAHSPNPFGKPPDLVTPAAIQHPSKAPQSTAWRVFSALIMPVLCLFSACWSSSYTLKNKVFKGFPLKKCFIRLYRLYRYTEYNNIHNDTQND